MTVSARTYISGARQPFHSRESVIQKPVEGSQHRPLAFSPEGVELKAESGVLHSQSRMTAEEESRETKQKQHEGRHECSIFGLHRNESQAVTGGRIIGESQPRDSRSAT